MASRGRSRTRLGLAVAAACAGVLLAAPAPALACPASDGNQTCTEPAFAVPCPPSGTTDSYFVNFDIRDDATNVTESLTFDNPCPGIQRQPSETIARPSDGVVHNPDGTTTTVPVGHHIHRINFQVVGQGAGAADATAHASLTYTDPTTTTGGGGKTTDCTPNITARKHASRPPVFSDADNEYGEILDENQDLSKDGTAIVTRRTFAWVIEISNSAPCDARVNVTDVLPAGFSVNRTQTTAYRPDSLGTSLSSIDPTSRSTSDGSTTVGFSVSVPAATPPYNQPTEPLEPSSVTLYITGEATGTGDLDNAALVDGQATNKVTVHVTPDPLARDMVATATTVSGTAVPGKATRRALTASPLWALKGVQVAIQRLGTKSCRWLASTAGRFKTIQPVGGSCIPSVWLAARGTTRWKLRFRRLPKGRYRVLARAVNRAGASDNRFATARGNAATLTVR